MSEIVKYKPKQNYIKKGEEKKVHLTVYLEPSLHDLLERYAIEYPKDISCASHDFIVMGLASEGYIVDPGKSTSSKDEPDYMMLKDYIKRSI